MEAADFTGKGKEEMVVMKMLFLQGFTKKTLVFTDSNCGIDFAQYPGIVQKYVQNKEPLAHQPDHFKNSQIQIKFHNVLAQTDIIGAPVGKSHPKSNFEQIFFVGNLKCTGILDTVSAFFKYYGDKKVKERPQLVLVLNNYELSRHTNFKPESNASFTNQSIILRHFDTVFKKQTIQQDGEIRAEEKVYHPAYFGVSAVKFSKNSKLERHQIERQNAKTYIEILQKQTVNLMYSTNYLSQVPTFQGVIQTLALQNKNFYGRETKVPMSSQESCKVKFKNQEHSFETTKNNVTVIDRKRERNVLVGIYFDKKVEDLRASFYMRNSLTEFKKSDTKTTNKNIDEYFDFTEDDLEL